MRPRNHLAVAIAALVLATAAHGQPGEKMSFENLDIASGVFKFNFKTGRIDRIGDGATLIIHPTDPAEKDLHIRAGEITMRYASDDAADPAQIIFDGDVHIEHPDATITSGHAEWDFAAGVIVFTKNPQIKSEFAKEARGEKITLDMENSTIELLGNTKMVDVDITKRAGGGDSDPSLFAASDVLDWPGLVGKLKAGNAADVPSPAKQIIATLDAQSRKMFQGASEEVLLDNKEQVVKMLNNAVKSPQLYSAEAWNGVAVDDATKALVDATPQSGEGLATMNRALLHAAFPAELAG